MVLSATKDTDEARTEHVDPPPASVAAKPDECTLLRSLRDWTLPAGLRQADIQKEAKESTRVALMELRALPDERSRALSLSLGFLLQSFDPVVEKQPDKNFTPEQSAANTTNAIGVYSRVAEQLADLAVYSTDAVVYATAYRHCDRPSWLHAQAKASCARLSTAQWARMDSDNATPWMQQAQVAAGAGDQSAVAEAFFRMSQAKRIDDHQRVAAQALLANLPENTSQEVLVAVGDFFMGLDAAVLAPGDQVLTRHCSAARLVVPGGDANLRQVCSDIADVLRRRGMSLFDLGTAIRLAKNGAWPAEKLALAQAQLDKLMQVVQGQVIGDVSSCQASKKAAAYRRDWIALGEVGALRQRVGNLISETR